MRRRSTVGGALEMFSLPLPLWTENSVGRCLLSVPHGREILQQHLYCSSLIDGKQRQYVLNVRLRGRTIFPTTTFRPRGTWTEKISLLVYGHFCPRTLRPQDTSAPIFGAEVSRTLRHQYRHVSRHFGNNAEMFKPFLAEHNNVILCYVRLMAWQWCLSSVCRM